MNTLYGYTKPAQAKSAPDNVLAVCLGKSQSPSGRQTILLVEDEPTLLAMTSTLLELLGYDVLPANTPQKAIQLAAEQSDEIMLLLTDIVMPEINGWDLAEKIQAMCPEIKCLFMSGYLIGDIISQGIPVSADSFIQKPFTKDEIAGIVRSALAP